MGMRTAALVLLLATSLTACGESKDKARELVDISGAFKEHYDEVVETVMRDYSPRYMAVMDEEIREVVEDKVPFDEIRNLRIDTLAAHLQPDELNAAIRAHDNPAQSKDILNNTPEGRSFLDKIFDAEDSVENTFQALLKEREPAILKALDTINNKRLDGQASLTHAQSTFTAVGGVHCVERRRHEASLLHGRHPMAASR
ncbi:hypothetical protein [Pseudomonas allokribbensis]|uniref:hypothetical protein n=1 Tax=Pseudomonas allokribbensis TaxID=2774460 RepID=UPI001787939A|nr:hypothetical protein [Pseudomonas allokribbensis]